MNQRLRLVCTLTASIGAILALPAHLAHAQAKGEVKAEGKAEAGGEGDGGLDFSVEDTSKPPAAEETPPDQMTPADDTTTAPSAEASAPVSAKDTLKSGDARLSWQDILVVKHRPFLKQGRFEISPTIARTINDAMITHTALRGELNYYLTEVLAVGLEGQYFQKEFGETFELVALQARRLPTLNKYNYAASLNFHYAPIYAKFAAFNKKIIHLEGFFTAGVGFTQSEVIPRDPALESWTNFLITPNVGFTFRVFLTRWMTLNLGVRDYIFLDKYEDAARTPSQSLSEAMDEADGKLINHIMFHAGLSFWFPMGFDYTTFR